MRGEVEVEIREIEPRDAAEVAFLVTQLGYERTADEVHGWIEDSAREQHGRTAFVACRQGEVVGWIEVSIVTPLQRASHGLIGGLVVKDGVRGIGVGGLLCDQAEAWAWEQEVVEMTVTSRSTRGEAHRFYFQRGYQRIKTSEVFGKARLMG